MDFSESGFLNARAEARSLYKLVGKNNETVQTVLTMIRANDAAKNDLLQLLPAATRSALRRAFAYRLQVELEFLQIVRVAALKNDLVRSIKKRRSNGLQKNH